MSHRRLVVVRFVITALLVIAAFWGSLFAYAEYEAHRAISLLAEASNVRIGNPEASALALLERYGGYKRAQEPLASRDQWTDLQEYDYQKNRQSDYNYEVAISPFGITTLYPSRLTQIMRAMRKAFPARLRPIFGMRNWGVGVDLAIRSGRVQSVSAMAMLEGRSQWLGHEWSVANEMPHHELQGRAFVVDSAILEMEDGGGTAIENILTTAASEQEIRTARTFNTECLTSIRGCNGLCDVAPHTLEYLSQHPDVRGNITPPKCRR